MLITTDLAVCSKLDIARGIKTDLPSAPPTWCLGLDCCVVSDLAWPTLRDEVNAAAGITDEIAGNGVRLLKQVNINSGESGAASTIGFLQAISGNERLRKALKLTCTSHVLLFNTEGHTDPITTDKIMQADFSPVNAKDVSIHFADALF